MDALAPTHLSREPFAPLCGANEANQATTQIEEHTTCMNCALVVVAELEEENLWLKLDNSGDAGTDAHWRACFYEGSVTVSMGLSDTSVKAIMRAKNRLFREAGADRWRAFRAFE